MKIALSLIALAICFVNTFLILEIKVDELIVSTYNERLRNNLNVHYKMGKYGPLTGIVVQKNGQVIFKKSPPSDSPQPLESITKSIASLVIGIAITRGDIKNVDQNILQFFPEYKNKTGKSWELITLRDLLTMNSGIEWDEDKRPEALNPTYQMYAAENPYDYIFSQKLDAKKQFNYSSANAALLCAIIYKTTGKSFAKYADEVLFKPLKITKYKWSTYKNGSTNTSGGLYLTLDDLTKIGQLYLQKGKWNGKKIANETWICDSFKNNCEVKGYLDMNAYGYMWWINDLYKIPGSGKYVKIYSACGFNNNHLIVIPELDLLIITMGDSTSRPEKYLNLVDDVLVGLKSDPL